MSNTENNDNNGSSSARSGRMDAVYDRLVQKLSPHVDAFMEAESNPTIITRQQYWVAIGGGAGSGKTTVAQNVCERLNAHYHHRHAQSSSSSSSSSSKNSNSNSNNESNDVAIVVPMDGFHYTQKRLKELHGLDAMKRRGAPWTFDTKSLYESLSQLKQTQSGTVPSYCRNISDPVPGGVTVRQHHCILLVEGLYLLHERDPDWAPLQSLWDERWYVQAPTKDIQKERLVQRSLKTWSETKAKEWGHGVEGATKRAEANDFRNLELIEYCKDLADEVVVTM